VQPGNEPPLLECWSRWRREKPSSISVSAYKKEKGNIAPKGRGTQNFETLTWPPFQGKSRRNKPGSSSNKKASGSRWRRKNAGEKKMFTISEKMASWRGGGTSAPIKVDFEGGGLPGEGGRNRVAFKGAPPALLRTTSYSQEKRASISARRRARDFADFILVGKKARMGKGETVSPC